MPIKVLVLTKYGRLGASSRMRFLQYGSWLQQAGLQMMVAPLLSDELLQARYEHGGYGLPLLRAYFSRIQSLMARKKFDVVWIEKEALPWLPLWLELALLRGVPYVLDYDDAVYHHYDQHSNSWVRRIYGQRLDGLMAKAALVIGGNSYLAQRASAAGARNVAVIPTVVNLDRYPIQEKTFVDAEVYSLPRIVWIGSPSTVHYLKLLREPLQILAERQAFVLRVIGGAVDIPGVQMEVLPWSEATEFSKIRACNVGVMPLLDSSWERGKCGYKLIQYMACGLPVVASNVGVNTEIVQHGENGFLANTREDWVVALGRLLGDERLSAQLGVAGRQQVERSYCIQKTGLKMAELLRSVAGRH